MKIKYIRRTTQIIFFIIIIYGGFLIAQYFHIVPSYPPKGTESEVNLIDQSLPFRTCRYIQPKPTLFQACSLRYLLNLPINMPPLYAIAIPLAIILILYFSFGRFICGWMCPLGFTSDIMNYCRQKLKISRVSAPEKLKNFFVYWRYSFLLFLIFLSIALIIPFLEGFYMSKNFYEVACQICPSRMILPLFAGKMFTMPVFQNIFISFFSVLSIIFLLIYLSGLFMTRAWCRICPNGSLTSLFNKGSLITKEKDVQKCTRCGVCKRVCPFENEYVYDEKKKKIINNRKCISCFTCLDKCPEKDCLKAKFAGKTIFSSKFKK
jgi:ferredoxin-type protein NapH